MQRNLDIVQRVITIVVVANLVAQRLDLFLEFDEREILQDAGKITAKIAKEYAESEFEKYRIIQDKLFKSDFDQLLEQKLNSSSENDKGES